VVKTIILDAGPLGLLADTRTIPVVVACKQWANDLLAAGHQLIVPEIADYEVRRELLRMRRTASVALLDQYVTRFVYHGITTAIMRRAAELWAIARQIGQPTAGNNTIDGDIILIALAESLAAPNAVIATTNVGHIARFFPAELWSNITP